MLFRKVVVHKTGRCPLWPAPGPCSHRFAAFRPPAVERRCGSLGRCRRAGSAPTPAYHRRGSLAREPHHHWQRGGWTRWPPPWRHCKGHGHRDRDPAGTVAVAGRPGTASQARRLSPQPKNDRVTETYENALLIPSRVSASAAISDSAASSLPQTTAAYTARYM